MSERAASDLLTALAARLPDSTPFVGPEAQERARGRPFAARLGANENGFGPSPQAVDAMAAAATEAWKYGDPECAELKAALAAHHQIEPSQVVVGEGVDGLLGLAVRLLIGEGDVAVAPRGGYPTFAYHMVGFGGAVRPVDYRAVGGAERADLDAMAAAAHETGARAVYIANPDNPMGGAWPAADIRRLHAALPDRCVLLLDEAYAECAPGYLDAPGGAVIDDPERPRLLRFRSFSKVYGLAGLRVGYAVGPAALIAAFDKVRNHFGVGRIAQAGAHAALGDQAYLARTLTRLDRARARIGDIARGAGLTPLPSATNFVTIDCGGDGAFARAVLDGLLSRDVFARMPAVAPLDRCIRISCGPDAALERFATALDGAVSDARARQARP